MGATSSKRPVALLIPLLLLIGCSRRDYRPGSTYYDRNVAPELPRGP